MTEYARQPQEHDEALAYFDGGPADGWTLEQRAPQWAPLSVLHVNIDGVDIPYVLATQSTPRAGEAWRYIPDDGDLGPRGGGQANDPFDD